MKSWIKGADLSSLLEVETCGGVFSDRGVQGDAMEILAGYGFNLVRLRLWNDPYSPQGEPYGAG
ncbi:MAG: glycosyl hydrolase 53 family protein, partial [Clostridiales bacterium]|nr:glycosyl hydrolase 53 family protein [Clostridiales bacterium]